MSKDKYDPSNWDHRILCMNSNCIGAIGGNGKCKVCGIEYKGELPFIVDSSLNTSEEVFDIPKYTVTGNKIADNINRQLRKEYELIHEIIKNSHYGREEEPELKSWHESVAVFAKNRTLTITVSINHLQDVYGSYEDDDLKDNP